MPSIAFFGFKFFSPSKELVIIKQFPSLLEEESTIMSAGMYSSSSTQMTSPTYKSFHSTSTSQSSVSWQNLLVFLELVSKSDLYLLRSSYPSLIIDKDTTNTKGAIADKGFKGEICGIDCKIATIKKYTFAYLLNWLNKETGKNEIAVYLVVRI